MNKALIKFLLKGLLQVVKDHPELIVEVAQHVAAAQAAKAGK